MVEKEKYVIKVELEDGADGYYLDIFGNLVEDIKNAIYFDTKKDAKKCATNYYLSVSEEGEDFFIKNINIQKIKPETMSTNDDTMIELSVVCFDGSEKNFIIVSPEVRMYKKSFAKELLKTIANSKNVGGIDNVKEIHNENFILRRKNKEENFMYMVKIGYIKKHRIMV